MSDHRALIEWARGAYRPYEVQRLITSLAEALEQATPICGAIPSEDGPHSDWHEGPAACPTHAAALEVRAEAAERRLAEIATMATQQIDTPLAGQLLRQIEQLARAELPGFETAGEG